MEASQPINRPKRIALVGNPNLGKTTLFNALCGLRQKTGNYPGVTVTKKKGSFRFQNTKFDLIDLPGINSMFPKSKDEELVVDYLTDTETAHFPDVLLVLGSALNLKRSLYLLDQIRDLNRAMILAVNMSDLAEKRGIRIDIELLERKLGIPVVLVDAKNQTGFDALKLILSQELDIKSRPNHFIQFTDQKQLSNFQEKMEIENPYRAFLKLILTELDIETARKWKTNESILRYKFIRELVNDSVKIDKSKAVDFTSRADKLLVHKAWGYIIFALIMLGIFQGIFLIATYPMDWIDMGFASLSFWTAGALPEGYFSDLITQGIIPGIGGVVIFVPQIAILFFLFSLLEESGYMQRIVFLMDRIMQRFGMSGKSVVPMISGMACAVPAIMTTRTIENNKERLITILITPLMTCSARIPVYIVLIALIIPDDQFVGIFQLQGLLLMMMYLLGVLMTLIVAYALKFTLTSKFKSFLIIDMPEYLKPDLKTVSISVWNNVKSFLWSAGRIILATSIVLFVLATNGGENFRNAEENVMETRAEVGKAEKEAYVAAYRLEHSYLGVMGKAIEPAIAPLGYDWKIGIALITSLAAREVFVGSISTIYSINSDEGLTIRDRLRGEKTAAGKDVFSFATCVSLLLFYAFALQCFSTIAVTYKETKSLKWTGFQFLYMTILAYFSALIAFQLLT